jgi:ACS family tartrate transporter-like MFS transporter
VIGAPVSGLLLGLDSVMGLKGWQWLFIVEGMPSVLLGLVTWLYLTDKPEHATWLTSKQKAWLASKLKAETTAKQAATHWTLGEALSSPKVIALSLAYFGFVGALYGMQFWLPQIVKAFGLSNAQTGFVTAIPYLFGTIAMILWARHSDKYARTRDAFRPPAAAHRGRTRGQRFHSDHGGADGRCDRGVLHVCGVMDAADRLAGAIALINSIGNLAGFGGPYLIGWVKEATGSTSTGLLLLAALPLISGLLVFVGGHESKAEFSGAKCGPAPTTSSQTSERQRARSGTHTPRLLVKARWRRLCKTGIGGYGPRPSSGRRRMLANIPLGLGVVILVNTHEMMMTDDY